MSQYAQNDIPVAYPPAQQGASYVMAPPPVGYPLKDGAANPENQSLKPGVMLPSKILLGKIKHSSAETEFTSRERFKDHLNGCLDVAWIYLPSVRISLFVVDENSLTSSSITLDIPNLHRVGVDEDELMNKIYIKPTLGTMDRKMSCETCTTNMAGCLGHFGRLELAKPIFHIGFMKTMLSIMRCFILDTLSLHCGIFILWEDELQLQKLKKRKIKANPRLSFSEDFENGEEEDGDDIANYCKCSFYWLTSQVRKGDTIGEFLQTVRQQLAPEFREVRTTSVENLLYGKEDLMIPHQRSFYELIVNKARGKSGPLFHFDVHEDVRTIADATVEKDELLIVVYINDMYLYWLYFLKSFLVFSFQSYLEPSSGLGRNVHCHVMVCGYGSDSLVQAALHQNHIKETCRLKKCYESIDLTREKNNLRDVSEMLSCKYLTQNQYLMWLCGWMK
ncbi:protein XAP5 CIRCADIAN TIMEKEEPER [Artemisia annua]|uniref:DNA-directed RNA polymerase n=1 Tax=Artemisia annua TaxID=35608 RepID=A0A2U1L2E9_ARTAN|nr:protein XAP5 CIRCADIAN TIMEKEEPER [Artemisia annua]